MPLIPVKVVALGIAGATLLFHSVYAWRTRRLTRRLFAGREVSATELDEIRTVLEAVNRECKGRAFGAARAAHIPLHGKLVCLVDGSVVAVAGDDVATARPVFAVADRDEASWLRVFSDVFEIAFAGSQWSIFWVKVPALLRITKR